MTNTLKKLQSKQLIRVEPDKNSGRRKLVTMTPKGRKVRDQAIGGVMPLLREFAEQFPPEKIQRQTRQLAAVRAYLDAQRFRQD